MPIASTSRRRVLARECRRTGELDRRGRCSGALHLDALDAAAAHGDDLHRVLEITRGGVCGEPGLGRALDAAELLVVDHLERVAVTLTGLVLHLDEDNATAAAHDQVDLVASRPD